MKRSLLNPSDDQVLRRLNGSKRRVRAQNHIDFFASSTSIDSNSSSTKSSIGRKTRIFQRGSMAICKVILTIQSASSEAEDSPNNDVYFIFLFEFFTVSVYFEI